MIRVSPRNRRHDLTRQNILDNARSLLVSEGLNGISMRALAEKTNYSPAALYKYFDSKEAIVEVLRQEAWQMMASFEPEPPPAGITSLADLFVHSGQNYIRFASQHPQQYQLIMSTTETGPASLEEFKNHPNFIDLLHFVEAAVSSGEFELPDGYTPLHLAMLSWFTVHGISLLKLTMMNKCQEEFESISLEVLEMVKVVFIKK
ncbi:MAG: TetR/AcrR family transcriptional regulator [Anaerolineae bacterium]|jgi:AcrR family transcriptional regulator|nr:TetR/AcrR family transcriptional regulator [Anaerolineae bacterium]